LSISINKLSTPKPYKAPIKCSTVETLAPLSFDMVVQNNALLTLKTFGIIILFSLRSVLLKIIPVFGLAGLIIKLTSKPL